MNLGEIPQQVGAGGEAQGAGEDHPYPGDAVDAALWDGSDTSFLTPATAQQCVGAYNDAGDADEREQEAEGKHEG